MKNEKATFAAGCFWGVEEKFRNIKGVISTKVGYTGGKTENPDYHKVCSGKTGHTESVEIQYNPDEFSYNKLLEIFWNLHDPTTLNRQGPDVGSQYRSVIFYHNEEQKKLAEKSKQKEQEKLGREIVTEIIPAQKFYEAEEYHQKYLMKKRMKSCSI